MIKKSLKTLYLQSLLFIAFYCFLTPLFANDEDQDQEPPKEGFFAIRSSQMPTPLVGLGQTIVDQGQALLGFSADDNAGHNHYEINLTPSLLYGMRDDLSVYFFIPVAARFKSEQDRSSGLEDMLFQLEHAYYTNSTNQYAEEATILGNVSFPTGSTEKNPSTGLGVSSFLVGTTYSRFYTTWYGFTSFGAYLPLSKQYTKSGDQFLYQCGVGRPILNIGNDWLIAAILEFDGEYTKKDRTLGETDPDSGGNVIMITPSLWVSSYNLIFQLGIGTPALQKLNGDQSKTHYVLITSMNWTF